MSRYMGEQEWLDIFGDNLRDILEEQWTSRSEIADAIGVSEATISRYINKTQMPSIRSLINMSCQLSIPLDELIDFDCMID